MSSLANQFPACPKCRAPLGPELFNRGQLIPCPNCTTEIRVEVFPAMYRTVEKARPNEAVMIPGESACFYHDSKRAVVVCDSCGRFLCALCDFEFNNRHVCPQCLESSQKKGAMGELEVSRKTYAHLAFVYSLIPLFLTGLCAIYLAARYWKAPGSLVRRRRWEMPAALVLGILQTLAFIFLILLIFYH
jgi:hypothetical protein